MEASEAEASTQKATNEERAPSDREDGRAKPKRAAGAIPEKKQKKARVSKPAYTVHEGEDMLFVISNSTSQDDGSIWTARKKGSRKKKLAKGRSKSSQVKKKKTVRATPPRKNKPAVKTEEDVPELSVTQEEDDRRWGQSLPEEVLVSIFQMVVVQDGAVPFLCRYHT